MKHIMSLCLLLSVVCSPGFGSAHESTAVGSLEPAAKARTNTVVPVFRLSGIITEKPVPEDMPFSFGGATGESLKNLLSRLKKVANDNDVPAIVLELNNPILGRAQLEEVNRTLSALKEAGKKIHVHTDLFTTGQFALIAHASELSMVPTGYMFITGLYGEQIFLRGLLDRVGVTPDYFTCGDYKSAGEMFM